MNKVILMGRLTRDPEVRYSAGDNSTAVARYTLAVNRRFKRDNEPTADFVPCVAFGKAAEFAEKQSATGGIPERIRERCTDNMDRVLTIGRIWPGRMGSRTRKEILYFND